MDLEERLRWKAEDLKAAGRDGTSEERSIASATAVASIPLVRTQHEPKDPMAIVGFRRKSSLTGAAG